MIIVKMAKCKKGYVREGNKCVKKRNPFVSSSANINYGTGGGVGFTGLLTLLFIGLKLSDKINWSWWWVLSPLWISALIGVVLILIFWMVMRKW